MLIHQYTVNYAGGQRLLNGAAVRFDDIDHVEYGQTKILTQLYMQVLNGLLNCFIVAQLIMQASLDFDKYFGYNPIRTVIAIALAIFGLGWAYEWIKSQFIDGYKTLIVKFKDGVHGCEVIYDERLEEVLMQAKNNDKPQIKDCEQ